MATEQPDTRRKRAFFLIVKLASLALVSLYSFELIYVLVRALPAGFYPWIVLLSSIGGYVLAADLGFSIYVYAVVRRGFLEGALDGADRLVSDAATVYALCALVATAIASAVIMVVAPPGLKVALSLYFASIVAPLPWMLVRRTAAALDLYVEMETLECLRRALACVLAALMLAGLGLAEFAVANLMLWALAMVAAWMLLRRQGFTLHIVAPGRLAGFLARNRAGIVRSSRFTGLEFLIFNFPYVAIPLMFHGPANLVAYDLFVKVTRFGATAYLVASDLFTPLQTRHFYARDRAGVRHCQRSIGLIGLIPLICAAAILLAAGGPLFARLLAGAGTVDPPVRVAMIAMLGALLLQTMSGGFLVAVNQYRAISAAATITLLLMIALVVVGAGLQWSFPAFMLAYVGIFWVHAALCQRAFLAAVRTGPQRKAADTARPPVDAVEPA